MANSKYEYVKSFESEDEVMLPNLILVRIDGRDFSRECSLYLLDQPLNRFSQVHEFEKPNDEAALNLMNSCSAALLEEFPDIIFAYGYSDEYSFVFKKTSRFYQRRASKILSLVASFFAAVYVTKWKEFFPQRKLEYAPSFTSQVVSCASPEVLQAYLAWRQQDCHANNQYETCFWMLVKSGKTITETQELLKDTQKQQKNELLFQKFDENHFRSWLIVVLAILLLGEGGIAPKKGGGIAQNKGGMLKPCIEQYPNNDGKCDIKQCGKPRLIPTRPSIRARTVIGGKVVKATRTQSGHSSWSSITTRPRALG
ncbi:Thg1 C-terminal domain protein [Raphanus sativus]|nr:Thg1 C-terminal domain protein [Raphanus sativus]